MNILKDKIYVHADALIIQPLEHGVAVMGTEADKVIILNITGAAIWHLFDGQTSCSQIVSKVALHFSTPVEQLAGEVYALIERLVLTNLILEKTYDHNNI
jgi:hypothetical protein